MSIIPFGAAVRKHLGIIANEPKSDKSSSDKSSDAAWLVLEAANDLGDHATVEACRRVIDANLNGTQASQSDLHIVLDYFR